MFTVQQTQARRDFFVLSSGVYHEPETHETGNWKNASKPQMERVRPVWPFLCRAKPVLGKHCGRRSGTVVQLTQYILQAPASAKPSDSHTIFRSPSYNHKQVPTNRHALSPPINSIGANGRSHKTIMGYFWRTVKFRQLSGAEFETPAYSPIDKPRSANKILLTSSWTFLKQNGMSASK